MRVSSLLVLSLVLVSALVSSAPIEKAAELNGDEEVVEVAKRDQEMLMFGNQQNYPRMKKKKSDPAVPALTDTLDKQGFIEAVPVSHQEKAETDDSEEQVAEESDDNLEKTVESAEAELPPIKQQIPEENSEESNEEEAEPAADTDTVEEELKGIMADGNAQEEAPVEEADVEAEEVEVPEVPTEVKSDVVQTDEEVPEETEDESVETEESKELAPETEMVPAEPDDNSLMDFYYNMLESEKSRDEPQSRDYYYDLNYYPYRRRRSSRRTRAVTEGGMTHNDLKRSKRIKRDLFDDDVGYYYPYAEDSYVPELSDDDLYELYRVSPKYEDEVATLLDMYQQAPEEQSYQPYEPYPVEEVYPELYEEEMEEEEEPEYVPSKRQMMSTLPGIKKRYFYPFSREPQTHFGAFVPEQKRDYDETYRRLLALASALSEESPYYQAYRKK